MTQQSGPSFVPRVSMYDAQAQNRWRTVLLIVAFTLLVVAVAFVFGDILGGSTSAGVAFIPFAILFSAGSSLFSYYAGDKLVLAQSRAREVPDGEEKVLRDVVESLKIPSEVDCLTVVNGRDAAPEFVLSPGDELAMFPPLSGGA